MKTPHFKTFLKFIVIVTGVIFVYLFYISWTYWKYLKQSIKKLKMSASGWQVKTAAVEFDEFLGVVTDWLFLLGKKYADR